MTRSLITPPATAATPISTTRSKNKTHFPLLGFQQRVVCTYQDKSNEVVLEHKLVHRRTIKLGLAGAMLGLTFCEQSASAARRPPPPPPEEKKDPSLSGLQAKVLASKKRKEAMKQSMAQQRERGKAIKEPVPPANEPPPPANEEPSQ